MADEEDLVPVSDPLSMTVHESSPSDAPDPVEVAEKIVRQEGLKLAGIPIERVSERSEWVKLLLYGVPGSGKTYLAGSASEVARMSPVLFIDIEGGTKTLRNVFPDVDVIRIRDKFDDKGRLVKSAWKRLFEVYEDLRRGVPHNTIVLDSLTEAYKMSMYSVMADVMKSGDRQNQDPDVPAVRDWGKSSEQIRRMVRALRDMDKHVIFTALQNDVKDQMTGAVTSKPSLPGKLADEIPAYIDEVLYLWVKAGKEGVERKILTEPTGKFIAKDRSGMLPTTMTNPTMARIAELVLDKEEV
jgi:hypothetical protein